MRFYFRFATITYALLVFFAGYTATATIMAVKSDSMRLARIHAISDENDVALNQVQLRLDAITPAAGAHK